MEFRRGCPVVAMGDESWLQGDVCRASCCCGYTSMTHEARPNNHDAQAILDRWGFINGYFGADHQRICTMVVSLLSQGSDVVQRLVSLLVREGAVPESAAPRNGSNGSNGSH